MIVNMLIAVLLSLTQVTMTAESDDPNVFVDLGAEYCAEEIAIAAFENIDDGKFTGPTPPEFITYSAFEFVTEEQAEAVLDDIPLLVAETYSDDVDISEDEAEDQFLTEIITEEYGDRSAAYILTLPVDEEDLDTLVIEMLAIAKQNQLVLILLFNDTTATTASPGLTLDAIPPLPEELIETWDGTGDIAEAIPSEDQMPIGWEGEDVSTVELPTCEQQEE